MILAFVIFAGSALGSEPARIDVEAQLWTRPLGKESRLKFRRLGDGMSIATVLQSKSKIDTYSTKIVANEIYATVTFIVVPSTPKIDAYLTTQIRVYNARTGGLIAECANYAGIRGENGLGVGVCSGVIGGGQFGLTLAKNHQRTGFVVAPAK